MHGVRVSQAITEALQPFIASGDLPGLVAIVADRDGAAETVALGAADPATGTPMQTDTVFRLASMTKLVTAVGVMRLVDDGRVALDDAIADHLPEFDDLRVLVGFDHDGTPLLRPQRTRPTVRQVLANTSGLAYEIWNGDMHRYYELTGTPSAATGAWKSLQAPLVCEPGAEIHYGTGADWAGVLIQRVSGTSYDAFLESEIFPLLHTTDMGTRLTTGQRSRLPAVLTRTDDGGYAPTAIDYPLEPDFRGGGGSIYATAADFLDLQLLLLNGGTYQGRRLLSSESVAEIMRPQSGPADIPPMPTWNPFLSKQVEFDPGMSWGLGMCVGRRARPDGRKAMTGSWAGLFNTYFWIDRESGVAAGLYLQLVPFCDDHVLAALRAFERAVYASLGAGGV